MKTSYLLAALALTAATVLSACTGTSEEQAPTLLVVGVQSGAGSQLLLVEHAPSEPSLDDRMRFVPGSRRPLQAPAVAIDVTERDLNRAVAWVLTRSVVGSTVQAYLEPYNVAGIDVEDPTAFAAAGPPVPLVGAGGILPLTDTTNTLSCPTALQTSRDGTYLLVLDVPTHCVPSSGDFPVMWLVNTVQSSAVALQVTNDVLGLQPYTDQLRDDERGFFLVAGPGVTQVFAVDFEDGTSAWFGQRTLDEVPQDLQQAAGGGSVLVGVTGSRLVGVDLERPASSDQLGPVNALTGVRHVVVYPLGVDEVVLLTASQVSVHSSLADSGPTPDTVPFSGAGAAIDGVQAWAYVLGEGQVMLIDLYTGSGAGEPLSRGTVAVPELTLPTGPTGLPLSVITWVRAAEPPPGP